MHELGIVFHCIDELKSVAKEQGLKKIDSATISLGEVSAVIPSYFQDCWKWAVAKEEDVLKDTGLKIEIIKAVTFCEDCRQEYPTVEHGKTCPYCGSVHTFLVTGNEFMIKEVEVCEE